MIVMYLEPTATFELGLLMFYANHDIRCIKSVELKVCNPEKHPGPINDITEDFEDISVEAEFVLNYCCFKAKITPDGEYWSDFVNLFFLGESPIVERTAECYMYENCFCYGDIQGYGVVWEDSDTEVAVGVHTICD